MMTKLSYGSVAAGTAARFCAVRQRTLQLCEPLLLEDYGVSPWLMPVRQSGILPTSWFFDTFILSPWQPQYATFHPAYAELFSSYYNGVGDPFPRACRGNLSRPTLGNSRVSAFCRSGGGRVD